MNNRILRSGGAFLATLAWGSLMVAGFSFPAEATTCGSGQISNGGFESPVMSTLVESDIQFDPTSTYFPGGWYEWNGGPTGWAVIASLPGATTAAAQSLVWRATEGGVEVQDQVAANSGAQYAEITGLDVTNTLYQTVETVPGTVMTWTLAHRSASGTDVMSVRIGPDLANVTDQVATDSLGATSSQISDTETWQTWTGSYTVPEGQTSTVFGFHGVSSGSGNPTIGNYIDDIGFVCDQAASDASGGASDTGTTDSGLAMTGWGVSGLIALFVVGVVLFAFGTGTFGAKTRLRGVAVDLKVNEHIAAINKTLARSDTRNRVHRRRHNF